MKSRDTSQRPNKNVVWEFLFYLVAYSVYLIAGRRSNKMNVGENWQDFLKWGYQKNKQKDNKEKK